MATSAFMLMSIINNNTMPNMIYLNTQDKNKLRQFKKQQCENKRFQMSKYKELLNNSKTSKTYNTNSKHYKYSNFNIVKENKR